MLACDCPLLASACHRAGSSRKDTFIFLGATNLSNETGMAWDRILGGSRFSVFGYLSPETEHICRYVSWHFHMISTSVDLF